MRTERDGFSGLQRVLHWLMAIMVLTMLFIGVSNELGEFESGLTAHWFGTVPAVVLGGVGTLAVIGLWAWLFPELRKADQLTVAEVGME